MEIKIEFEKNYLVLKSPPEMGWKFVLKEVEIVDIRDIKIVEPDTGKEI